MSLQPQQKPRSRSLQPLGPPEIKTSRPYPVRLDQIETENNYRLISEYQKEIARHYRNLEVNSAVEPKCIDQQPELEWYMRPYLIDFLLEIHACYKLKPHTLFLTCNIIDRYCATRQAYKHHYHLVGCTALWIAAKYEDKKSRVPTVRELVAMCRNNFDENMFKDMEICILKTLNWSLGHTSLEDALQLAVTCARDDSDPRFKKDSQMECATIVVGRYLCELSLFERAYLCFPTSMVATAAHLIACSMLDIPIGAKSLERITLAYEVNSRRKMMRENRGENSENTEPKVYAPLVIDFEGLETVTQLRQLALLFVKSLRKPSELLFTKYRSLGVIGIVNDFMMREETVLSKLNPVLESVSREADEPFLSNLLYNPQVVSIANIVLGIDLNWDQMIKDEVSQELQPVFASPFAVPNRPPIAQYMPTTPYRYTRTNSGSSPMPMTPPSVTSQSSTFSSFSSQTSYSSCPPSENLNDSMVDIISKDPKKTHNSRDSTNTIDMRGEGTPTLQDKYASHYPTSSPIDMYDENESYSDAHSYPMTSPLSSQLEF
ncbi:unnamed protein product [Kuraishia capsulata CBS 1993]|uniref:Cyclin-like domain-containing protein n=1 Tax=Kuraishia capsulata CBS 1993 TaxID=1382522 RepID=W6MW59_9ASCO|nr:uncharacterized protein KUCA_T00002902001 [Kuraishia capsulata CBS 1993]CDK26925.1 unnamed protein product [Kuraishia capsulata CBS 1993]